MKRISFFILIFLFFVLIFYGFQAQAGTEHNVWGWAFAENIGWISFNCYNDYDGDGSQESHCKDAGYGSDYGVSINSDGLFSGYAWAGGGNDFEGVPKPTIGWISFADFDGDGDVDVNDKEISGSPCAPNCEARLNLISYEVSGWARALAPVGELQAGGWDGWIKFSWDTGSVTGTVSLNNPTKEFEGWAWGGDDVSSTAVIGWISFNHLNCDSDDNGFSDQGKYTQCPVGQQVSDYKVQTSFSLPPSASNLSVLPKNYCTNPSQYFSWTFSDPENDSQGAYQLQVDKEGDFSFFGNGEFDSGKVPSDSKEKFVLVAKEPGSKTQLGYKTHYHWRLRVWDDNDTPSTDWFYGSEFNTEPHIYPDPNFAWSPLSPTKEEIVQFCSVFEEGVCEQDESKCYDTSNNEISCSGKNFLWAFPGVPEETEFATGSSETSENPQVKFNSTGQKNVSLQITDDIGTCSTSTSIGVTLLLPKWREAIP